ncbi:MAG TPA: ABC transporter permease [Candidatus Micrarchaeia archaeon]|nr:ABC transporter permease [Candidatus Micrarchaeia archaeon]
MLRFIARRAAGGVGVLWGIITLVFVIGYALPINPARIIAGRNAPRAVVESIYRELGLNHPLWVQYGGYLVRLAHANLGQSYATNQPVTQALAQRLPYTIELVSLGVFGELIIGLGLAILAAARRGSRWDGFASVLAMLGLTLPTFWLGLLLLYVLAFRLPIFPLGGVSTASWVVLPAFSIAFTGAGYYTRMGRASLLEELSQEYVRTARAKGASEARVLFRHTLRNALRPVVTMAGLDLATLMGGVLVTEQVFGIPGLGTLAWNAILQNDLPMLEGVVLVIGVVIVVMTILIDIVYAWLDPRVTLASTG